MSFPSLGHEELTMHYLAILSFWVQLSTVQKSAFLTVVCMGLSVFRQSMPHNSQQQMKTRRIAILQVDN